MFFVTNLCTIKVTTMSYFSVKTVGLCEPSGYGRSKRKTVGEKYSNEL